MGHSGKVPRGLKSSGSIKHKRLDGMTEVMPWYKSVFEASYSARRGGEVMA